jgi:hypothetical protein
MGRRALRLLPLLAVAVFLFGLLALDKWARGHLRQDERYTLTFAAIECSPPPGQQKSNFLAEVQYLAGLPETLSLLDDDLPLRLTEGFRRHPWVEAVEELKFGRPPRIEARLRYRRPVLAVAVSGQLRAVDANGVLLPATADTGGLPVFSGKASPPAGPAGMPWGDPAVEAAARASSR